jgi:hypothetical protein
MITTAISWRAAFVFQAVVVAVIVLLSRRLEDPLKADPTRPFDAIGAILSAVGMFCIVVGILQAGTNNTLMATLLVVGVVFLPASSSTSGSRSGRARSRCSPPGCSRSARATSPSSPRTSSGCSSWGRRSSSPSTCRRPRLQRDQDRRRLHRRDVGILISSLAAERLAKAAQKTLIVAASSSRSSGSAPDRPGRGLVDDLGLRARAVLIGSASVRCSPLRERRAVELPRGSPG